MLGAILCVTICESDEMGLLLVESHTGDLIAHDLKISRVVLVVPIRWTNRL